MASLISPLQKRSRPGEPVRRDTGRLRSSLVPSHIRKLWQEQQHPRDNAGKFGSGGASTATHDAASAKLASTTAGSDKAASLGSKSWAACQQSFAWVKGKEHQVAGYLKGKAEGGLQKLSPRGQAIALGTLRAATIGLKATFVTYTAGQAFCEQIAKAKGLSNEQAQALRGAVTGWDVAMYKPVSIALAASGAGSAALPVSFIPIGSAAYIAHSVATNPRAVLKAATSTIMATAKRLGIELHDAAGHMDALSMVKRLGIGEDASRDALEALADGLLAAGDRYDEYAALIAAGRDLTGDLGQAVELADAAMQEGGTVTKSFKEEDHPRADDGKFGVGGTAKPRHGEQASRLAEAGRKLKESMAAHKAERHAAFDALKEQAHAASDKANEHAEAANKSGYQLAWNSDNADEEPFTELETALSEYDPDAATTDRLYQIRGILDYVKQCQEIDQPVASQPAGDDGISPEDKAANKQHLQAVADGAKAALGELRAYIRHRKEMAAIKRGEAKGLRGTIGKRLQPVRKSEFHEADHPRADDGKFGVGGTATPGKPSDDPSKEASRKLEQSRATPVDNPPQAATIGVPGASETSGGSGAGNMETHEMTRKEYAAYLTEHKEDTRQRYLANAKADLAQAESLAERGDKDAPRRVAMFKQKIAEYSEPAKITAADVHKARLEDIKTAIEDGEEIPAHVKADYPHLFGDLKPISNKAGKVEVEDGKAQIKPVLDDAMRSKGHTRIISVGGPSTTSTGSPAVKMTTNKGDVNVGLDTRPELALLVKRRDEINDTLGV